MTRTITVLAGYVLIGLAYWFITPTPQPVKIVPVTEAQIKEGVKSEQVAKKNKRAILAARQVYKRLGCRQDFSEATGRAATEYGVSPRLLAGLVFVESSCNPNATDHLGSFGLAQVNTHVWGKRANDPATNLRIGARILASYVGRYGLVEGLHHYNGYSAVHGHEYVNKVLTASGVKG